MDANTRQLEAIFDPNVFFQVPLFQRPYVWNETDNWEPLWDDILALLDRQLRTGKTRVHFLGAIVLEQLSHSAGSIEDLTMRMSMRRFTRLTNGFSKKVDKHMHAVALHFMRYNFGRIHKTLRVTPAMEAGVSDHVWSLEEIAALVPEPVAKKRGPYKKHVISL